MAGAGPFQKKNRGQVWMAKEYDSIRVNAARTDIKRWLMRRAGGQCHLKCGAVTRILLHDPLVDVAFTRLPWPLSYFQAHNVTYRELVAKEKPPPVSVPQPHDTFDEFVARVNRRTLEEIVFRRSEVDAAIERFLRDADPAADVLFLP